MQSRSWICIMHENMSPACANTCLQATNARSYVIAYDGGHYLTKVRLKKSFQQAGQKLPLNSEAREKAESEIAFLDKHKEMMGYADFRKRGFFVGSGVMEAGCKTVIGSRMKQSGMEWCQRWWERRPFAPE